MSKWRFQSKLLGLCLFFAGVCIFISTISYIGFRTVTDSYLVVADESMPKLNQINDMYLSYRNVRINLRTLGIPDLSEVQAEEHIGQVLQEISNFEQLAKKYETYVFVKDEEKLYQTFKTDWESFKSVGQRAIDIYKTRAPDVEERLKKIFLFECPSEAAKFTEAVSSLKKFHVERANLNIETAKAKESKTNIVNIVVSFSGILLGLLVGFLFATSIVRKLDEVASHLTDNVRQITDSSQDVAESSQTLSKSSLEQASSLAQTAASLEQITSMIAKASENASTAAESSEKSNLKAKEGHQSVTQMLGSMQEISSSSDAILKQVNEGNRQMANIVDVIKEIGQRTKVINDIVFQTKLLSFNASVEAVRAGSHGKGFAVVAEEVGKLAQMSGSAAREITDMLEASIEKVETTVNETQQKVGVLVKNSREKVESGTAVANKCAIVLDDILRNVELVAELSKEISQANQEQSKGVLEINKAISQLDMVTQQNSKTSAASAKSATVLADQSLSLNESVENLLLVINGSSTVVESKKIITNYQGPNVIDIQPEQKVKIKTGQTPDREDRRFNVV